MPLKREAKTKARPAGADVTLEDVAEALARVADEGKASRDLQRLAAAKKLRELDRLYLAALRRREAGELQPDDPADAPPLTGLHLGAAEQMAETRVALMDDDKVDRERLRLKAAGELSQSDQLYRTALRERHARTKTTKKNRREDTP